MPSAYLQPVSARRRAASLGLTILVHVLIVWLLLSLTPATPRFSTDDGLQTFDVAASRPAAQSPRPRQQEQRKRVVEQRRVTPPPAPPIQYKDAPNVIWLSKQDFAKADLSKPLKRADADRDQQADPGAQAAAGGGADSKPLYGPAAGPGGQQMYAAQWQREPTRAELNPYLPPTPAGSWGIVACRTAPDFRVENCQTMGENPPGSGLATGIRRAAWQFRVIPPRVAGKPQIGVWVRIRIEITPSGSVSAR